MLASLNGHVEVVDKLLQHGATVDLQSQVYSYIYNCMCLNSMIFHHHTVSSFWPVVSLAFLFFLS